MSDDKPAIPAQEYDWRVGLKKAIHTAMGFSVAMGTALLPLALDHYSNEGNVAALLAPYPKYLGLAPFIAGAIRFAVNRRKQGGNG